MLDCNKRYRVTGHGASGGWWGRLEVLDLTGENELPRPDVIISVTGGAMAFDLPTMHKDMIMKGMMENTRDMQPLFITGGTNAGILRCAAH